jgi:hypothetical protein
MIDKEIEAVASKFDQKQDITILRYTYGQPETPLIIVKDDKQTHFAKTIINHHNNSVYFYVKLNANHRLYDPFDAVFHRHNHQDRGSNEFVKVSEQCFETYLNYLSTRNNRFLSSAERLSLDG